jgi:hypothetical protein
MRSPDVHCEGSCAGAGAAAFLPRQLPHAIVVTSPQARYLTFHTPAGFDAFTKAMGTPAVSESPPVGETPPDLAELTRVAAQYGIEILGPKPIP